MGTWNVAFLAEKELDLMVEVERFWLDIVVLTSTHSVGSGTQVLRRGHFSFLELLWLRGRELRWTFC